MYAIVGFLIGLVIYAIVCRGDRVGLIVGLMFLIVLLGFCAIVNVERSYGVKYDGWPVSESR